MNNNLQNDEFILPGNLGSVDGREIKSFKKSNDGTVIMTIGEITVIENKILSIYDWEWAYGELVFHEQKTEDADYEIIPDKQIGMGKSSEQNSTTE